MKQAYLEIVLDFDGKYELQQFAILVILYERLLERSKIFKIQILTNNSKQFLKNIFLYHIIIFYQTKTKKYLKTN
jgi:hypothetical protein